MSVSAPQMSRSTLIKWAITFIVPLCIFLIPTNDVYTSSMRMFLVITVFSLFLMGFEFFDNILPAMVMPIGYVIFGVADFGTAFSGFTSSVVYMCFGSYLLATILIEIGLLQRVAYWCLIKCGGTFSGLMIGIFLTGCVLTVLTFGGAGVIMTAIAYGICVAMGLKKGRTTSALMMAVLLGSTSVRLAYYSPQTLALPIMMAQQVLPDFTITFLQSVWHNWPALIMCLISLFVIIKWYKPTEDAAIFNNKAYFQEQLQNLGPMSVKEKKSAVFVVIVIIYMITQPLHGLPSDYAFMVFPWLLFLPGINVADNTCLAKMNYSMIFFLVACMGISTVATKIGLGALISSAFIPYFANGTVSTISILLFVICFLLNFLMTPMAIFGVLVVPITQASVNIGLDPRPFIYTLVHACEAIVFPYEFVPYLITYSFGMMTMKDFIKLNVVRSVIYSLGIALILIPWWYLIGVIRPL